MIWIWSSWHEATHVLFFINSSLSHDNFDWKLIAMNLLFFDNTEIAMINYDNLEMGICAKGGLESTSVT